MHAEHAATRCVTLRYVPNIPLTSHMQLEEEPKLKFSRLWAFDGNNSLKRVAAPARGHADPTPRPFDSDYFLPREYVDQYANEVQSRKKVTTINIAGADDADNDSGSEDGAADPGGDPTDGQDRVELSDCVKNWKSAAAEEKKKMWAIFDEA